MTRPAQRRTRAALALVALVAVAPGPTPAAESGADAGSPLPAAMGPTLASRVGAEDHGGAVWYRLRPPFDDPEFRPFAFEPHKNTWLALGEVVGVNLGLWAVNYWSGKSYAKIGFDTIEQNFRKGWIIDTDPYWVNQLGHPAQGFLFFTTARSTGHGFYESFATSFLGSLIWEQFMEVQPPSVNDQITTPAGGTLLGEVLFRLNRLILDSRGEKPGAWREATAFVVCPMCGLNRLATGDRYRGEMLLPPSWIGEFRLGVLIGASAYDQSSGGPSRTVGPWTSIGGRVIYGVPGTPDLRLRRPLDHFELDFGFGFNGSGEANGGLQIRGVLVGGTIGDGQGSGGLWGLFGSYDVTGVPVFKATGVGLGPGVSLMKRWRTFELHGTALAELLPWSGGGSRSSLFARDYHYGPGAKGTLELRGHFSDRATLDLGAREYVITGAYATGSSEDISYGSATLTVRIHGPHAVSGALELSRRHATYPDHPEVSQHATAWFAHYVLLQGW